MESESLGINLLGLIFFFFNFTFLAGSIVEQGLRITASDEQFQTLQCQGCGQGHWNKRRRGAPELRTLMADLLGYGLTGKVSLGI